LMSVGKYTELFFLDEATALAAGHRPCATCRSKRYKAFKLLWAGVHDLASVGRDVMDKILDGERISPDGTKATYSESIDTLPNGACIELDGEWFVVWEKRLLRWSFDGYNDAQTRPQGKVVTVLTPRSIVAVLRSGYVPELHVTASTLGS
jgi:hypothetical protein